VNGFDGSDSDYRYAIRLLRNRTPRLAVAVGSSLYYDIVYGPYAYDWNVYIDGGWAYPFPTWSNPIYNDWLVYGDSWYAFGWGYGLPYYHTGWRFHDWFHGYYHPHYGHHPHNYLAMNPHRSFGGRVIYHGQRPSRNNGHRGAAYTGSRPGVSRGRVVSPSGSRSGSTASRDGGRTGNRSSVRPGTSRSYGDNGYSRPSSTRETVTSPRTSSGSDSRYSGSRPGVSRSYDSSSRSSSSSSYSGSSRSSSGGSSGGSHSGGGGGGSHSGGGSSHGSRR